MISYPFESKNVTTDNPYGDRAITDEMEREFNQLTWTNGVFINDNSLVNSLKVSAVGGMQVAVAPGGCHINGAKAYESATRTFTLEASSDTYMRIDRIVARFDTSDSVRSIELYVKQGTPSTTAVAPTLVRASNYYELALADIYIGKSVTEITQSNITDQRLNSEVCGMVAPAFPTSIDTTDIFNQFQSALDKYMSLVQSAIDGTTAGNLQSEIDAANAGLTKANQRMLIFQDKSLDLTKAVSDTTYSEQGYTYHVDLALSGCTADYIPDVYLSAPSSVISDICQTGAGYVRFFVSTNTGTITIPVIRLTKGGE
ncbi:hypothetical protein [Mobilibacterium timonense]|uniref:hypothetical protein n=1 Tax=Mobilibacterium timonense TaxID=1871012 RepID=UPI00098696DB|nr:hypothetical protein [Mobilibacterium timonense]